MDQHRDRIAFVLGGGGSLGAYEVGMLRALLEAEIVPDLVLGTSVGALNGAVFAADPAARSVHRLERLWSVSGADGVFAGSFATRVGTALRSRTHLYSNQALRHLLDREIGGRLIQDLAVPFQCVAAAIERAAEHWFTRGPVVDAVLASCAVPGLLPPVEIAGEHYLDGGLVDSVPIGRALALGADVVYVLHVGRLERPLRPPRRAWEVAAVAFEIARRHRFVGEMTRLAPGRRVHLLPIGDPESREGWREYVRHRDFGPTRARMEQSYRASLAFLAGAR